MSSTNNKPTYDELREEIELLKLSIKLEEDTSVKVTLEMELMYVEEYLQHVINRGTP